MPSGFYKPAIYTLPCKGSQVDFYVNKHKKASFFVDVTDNRIMVKMMESSLDLQDIETMIEMLGRNFGAKQIFSVPAVLRKHFISCGFSLDPIANQNTVRMRVTSVGGLTSIDLRKMILGNSQGFDVAVTNIEASYDSETFGFISDKADILAAAPENIESLMSKSGFLKAKIDQYRMQGHEGFQLMCQYSMPFGIIRKSDHALVAFCRVTDLGNGDYYLGDTFVDEDVFGDGMYGKQIGTAHLYKKVGEYLSGLDARAGVAVQPAAVADKRILLIAPSGRVMEFDRNYGCTLPDNILLKFGAPQPGLTNVFKDEIAALQQPARRLSPGVRQ